MTDNGILTHIRTLIGCQFDYRGKRCTLVDLLTDEAIVVLRYPHATACIQVDLYGQPNRRMAQTREIQVYSADGSHLSDELNELLANRV